MIKCSGVLIWSGRKTEGLVCIFLSFAVLNSWWWVVAWRFYLFFLTLIKGKRRRGEFKVVLIVLTKSDSPKPRGVSHHPAFVFALST